MLKKLVVIFSIGFLLGIGFVMTNPTTATAQLSPCDGNCGYKIVCSSNPACTGGDQMHYKCYQWAPALVFCDGPWTCGCYALGCGPACIHL